MSGFSSFKESKLIFEGWRFFLSEGEESYFPWLGGLKALGSPDRSDVEEAFPNWKRMGCGAYRCVYQPEGEKDYVIKVVRKGAKTEEEEEDGYDPIGFLTAQNKVEFDVSKEFPLIFPKIYAHHPDFNWIVIDKVEVIINSSIPLMESLKVSFPEIINDIFEMYSFPETVLSYDNALELILMAATTGTEDESYIPLSGRLRKIYQEGTAEKIFDLGLKKSETFRELHKAINKYNIQISDLRGGNIGRTSDGRLVIIDASVWESV